MTQEQYNRAVDINKRLEELEIVKKELNIPSRFILTYCDTDDDEPCLRWTIAYIADILDRHDKIIREEIDAEIERLTKEIETL